MRSLTWGPGIKPPMTSKTPFEEHIPDLSFPFLGDREGLGVLLDFLAILTRCELDVLSIQYRVVGSMEEIAPHFGARSITGLVDASMIGPRWATAKSFEAKHADALRETIRDWAKGDDMVVRTLRRLGSSVARTGRFRLEDSILDLSIALETMYSIDREMRYKLGTRAGYFLGDNALERNRIFDIAKRFYDKRSEIVHGSRTSIEELERTSSEGFELARDTLLKLLRTEIAGNRNQFWNNLVMTGGMPSETAEPDSP